MLVVVRFPRPPEGFPGLAERALQVLAGRPGFQSAELGRSTDPDGGWVLVLRWASVGDWRRALSGYEVKLHVTPLLAAGDAQPGAFEVLAAHDGRQLTRAGSDLAPDAGTAGPRRGADR